MSTRKLPYLKRFLSRYNKGLLNNQELNDYTSVLLSFELFLNSFYSDVEIPKPNSIIVGAYRTFLLNKDLPKEKVKTQIELLNIYLDWLQNPTSEPEKLPPSLNKSKKEIITAKKKGVKDRKGFSFGRLAFTVLVFGLIGLIGYYFYSGYSLEDIKFWSSSLDSGKYDLIAQDVLGASAPNVLSFQGRLTDKSDTPITTQQSMTFSIYNVSSGGSALWTGTCNVTPDQDGIFSLILGSDCGSAISDAVFGENETTYLGITVGSDTEMTPRQRIASSAYALNADTLNGFSPSQTPGANNVPVLNSLGNLILGAPNSGISGSSGQLFLEGDYLSFLAHVDDITFNGGDDIIFYPSGNVGIGTSSPVYKLHALGTTYENADLKLAIENQANTNTGIHIGHDTSATAQWASIGYYSSSDVLKINNSGSFANNHLVIDTTGNIGIGTTSPGSLLDLEHDSGPYTRFSSSASSAAEDMGGLEWYQTIGDPNVMAEIDVERGSGAYDQGEIRFWTNNSTTLSEAMRIDYDGNVGIGTTSPVANLEVLGDMGNDDTKWLTKLFNENAGSTGQAGGQVLQVLTNRGSGMPGSIFQVAGSSGSNVLFDVRGNGNVGIGTTSPSYKTEIFGGDLAAYTCITDGDVSGGTCYEGLAVGVTGAVFGGNVGIGTSGPTEKLHVEGNLRIAGGGYIDDDATTGGDLDDWIKLNGYIELKSNTDNYGVVLRDSGSNSYLGMTQVNGASYFTDSYTSSNYFLKGDGANVTIRGDLEVSGGDLELSSTILTDSTSTAYFRVQPQGERMILYNGASSYSLDIYNGFNRNIRFNSSGDSWLNGGDVGIGTDSPSAKLTIEQNTAYTTALLIKGSSNAISGLTIRNGTQIKHSFSLSGDANLGLAGGSIGIGTSNPVSPLHVNTGAVGEDFTVQSDYPDSVLVKNDANSDGSWLGNRTWYGKNSAGTMISYATIYASSQETNSGGEGGLIGFWQRDLGSMHSSAYIDSSGRGMFDNGTGTFSPYYSYNYTQSGKIKHDYSLGEVVSLSKTERWVVNTSQNSDRVYGVVSLPEGYGSIPKELRKEIMPDDLQPGDPMPDINSYENLVPVAHLGEASTRVMSFGNNIGSGDLITASSFLKGFGIEADKAGQVLGRALENNLHWNNSCPSVTSLESISWPVDDGTNPSKPCYRVPLSSLDSVTREKIKQSYGLTDSSYFYVGKIMVFVNVSWYDPDVYLDSQGTVSLKTEPEEPILGSFDLSYDRLNNLEYVVNNPITGLAVNRYGNFAGAAIGELDVGLARSSSLMADNAVLTNARFTDLTSDSTSSTYSSTETLKASTIKVGSYNISENSSKFEITNSLGEVLFSVDQAGTVSFAGMIESFKQFLQTIGLVKNEETNTLIAETNFEVVGNTILNSAEVKGAMNVSEINLKSGGSGLSSIGGSCFDSATGTYNETLCAAQTMYLQKAGEGNLDILKGRVLIKADGTVEINEGDLIIKQGVVKASSNVQGSVLMPVGSTVMRVDKGWEVKPGSVILTPSYNTDIWVTDVDKTGFTINVSDAPSVESEIYYIVMFNN